MMRIRVGTRKSALARVQADKVSELIRAADPSVEIEIVLLGSIGDTNKSASFLDIGSVGVFTKSGEDALLKDEVDVVVHSLKDLPTTQPDGLVLACVPQREDPRDVLCGMKYDDLRADQHKIGTGSIRRAAQMRVLFPGITIVPVRGNVQPRLNRAVEKNGIDATILAASGLKRLDIIEKDMDILDPVSFPYAVAQGALGVECRQKDEDLIRLLKTFECSKSRAEVDLERALMKYLGAGCNLPVGVYATWDDTTLHLKATITGADGLKQLVDEVSTKVDGLEEAGRLLAQRLLDKGAGELLRATGLNVDTDKVETLLKTNS